MVTHEPTLTSPCLQIPYLCFFMNNTRKLEKWMESVKAAKKEKKGKNSQRILNISLDFK